MTFQHISSGNTLNVNCNESVPITLNSGQSTTLSYTIPNSPEPNGSWLFGYVWVDSYESKTATRGNDVVNAGGARIVYEFPSGTYNWTISQPSDGNVTVIYGSYIQLYPHCLPQIKWNGASSSTTSYGYTSLSICRGGSANLGWLVFDAASVTISDSSGNQVPFTVNGRGTDLPDEDTWEYGDAGYGASVGALPTPSEPTSYTCTATGFGGETTSSTVSVSFIPFSVSLSVNKATLNEPDPLVLTWSSVGAEAVDLYYEGPDGVQHRIDAPSPGGEYLGVSVNGHYAQPPNGTMSVGRTIVINGRTYLNLDYPSHNPTIFTAVAYSSGSCGTVTTDPVPLTVTFPDFIDGSTATGIISVSGGDGVVAPPGGGGASSPSIPRRSCLSAPGSRYFRAEDVSGGGISFHRAFFPVPKLMGKSLWEATSMVTSNPKDGSPALFLDHRGLTYCAFARVTPPTTPPAAPTDTSHDGVWLRRSDDLGSSWGAHIDGAGTTEIMAIQGGTLPAAASGNGSTLIGAVVGSDAKGYVLQTAYKSAGQLTFSAPVTAVDATGTPLKLQNSGIALCRAAEGPGRWLLSCLLKGDSATSEFFSSDAGSSWTKVATS